MILLGNLSTDLLNGFPISDFPLFLIQLFSAAALGLALQWLEGNKLRYLPLIAAGMALLTVFGKQSIQLAVLFVGVSVILSVMFREKLRQPGQDVPVLLAFIAGACCGAGYVIPALVAFGLVIFPLFWMVRRNS
jgi:predicted membrane-bound mannosyltransferase